MKISESDIFLAFFIFDIFLIFVIWRKISSKDLRAICCFLLFLPLFSFQQINHRTFAGFIVSGILAALTSIFPARARVQKKIFIGFLVIICFFTSCLGVFDFSLVSSKRRDEQATRRVMQRLLGSISLAIAEGSDRNSLISQEDLMRVYLSKMSYQVDAWGEHFHFSVEKKENFYDISLISSGEDRELNTSDDIVYKTEHIFSFR